MGALAGTSTSKPIPINSRPYKMGDYLQTLIPKSTNRPVYNVYIIENYTKNSAYISINIVKI